MTHLQANTSVFASLKDKVVVLTGGAQEIGKATVEQFSSHGAKVVFGDVNDKAASELTTLKDVHFVHCDASLYPDQLALFEKAEQLYGRVDVVVGNAGIVVTNDLFGLDSDWKTPPNMKEIDVNLNGAIYTTRIGLAYLRKNGKDGGDIVLTSSIAGFKESGGLAAYTASKHGVIGINRGLNLTAINENIRVNTVCPWMTKTPMAEWFSQEWIDAGLPSNESGDVANAILICASANRGLAAETHGGCVLPFAGKIVWVGGGNSYEIEDNIQRLEPRWLGEHNSKVLEQGQKYLSRKIKY